jgi:hypothetical protein
MRSAIESVRGKIINSYLGTIQDSFQQNSSQLKLINYGTGSGKTHQLFQAIYQTIEQNQDIQVVGIYVAPLREHLLVPNSVSSQYPNISVYKINSLEMQTTDENIASYKKWISAILKHQKFCGKHKIKISPEFQKVSIELGIKNWMRQSLLNCSFGLPITPQSFSEKQFFTIYVRSPSNKEAKAVANETFIQYCVPSAQGLDSLIKRGFRVYHAIGKRYSQESITTSEIIEHPLTALHFSTLTQNILKLSDNSQSSLLQKVAKILIEN